MLSLIISEMPRLADLIHTYDLTRRRYIDPSFDANIFFCLFFHWLYEKTCCYFFKVYCITFKSRMSNRGKRAFLFTPRIAFGIFERSGILYSKLGEIRQHHHVQRSGDYMRGSRPGFDKVPARNVNTGWGVDYIRGSRPSFVDVS